MKLYDNTLYVGIIRFRSIDKNLIQYVIEIFQFKMSIFVKPFLNKILEIQDTKGYKFVGVWSEFSTFNILLQAKADPKLMGD